MPARKTARKSIKRYQRNHSLRRATRTAVNGAKRAADGEDVELAEAAVRSALSTLDKAARRRESFTRTMLPAASPGWPPGLTV